MVLLYLDTNIYIDHFRARTDNLRPLGEFAFNLLRRAKQCDVSKARTVCRERRTPFNDTLHAVLAHRHNAAYLVTRNEKDFIELQDFATIILPENL